MNLDTQDLELIKTTVRAAVAEATGDLVSKTEFREFRAEARSQWEGTYSREMIDQFRAATKEEIDRLWAETNANKNVLATLWQNAYIKVGAIAALALQAWELWHLFQ